MHSEEGTMNLGEYSIVQAGFMVDDESAFLARLRRIADEHGVSIVCFNADFMAGIAHVRAALDHAIRSFSGEHTISNSFEMEALLYAAGTRQCQVAAGFGIHRGENRCYVCVCPSSAMAEKRVLALGTVMTENWEYISEDKKIRLMEIFSITKEEMETIRPERFPELVLERVALLDVYR
jgi:KEOPS complex subunit Cgi121